LQVGPEQSDDELAALEVGGVDVLRLEGWFYRQIAQVPGLEGKVLTALDTGGFPALVELLTVYHLDALGGYYPIENEASAYAEIIQVRKRKPQQHRLQIERLRAKNRYAGHLKSSDTANQ
jgi:hypothetical protein